MESQKSSPTIGGVDETSEKYDTNGKEVITEEEKMAKAYGFFQTIDIDGDGFIDRIDVQRSMGNADELQVDEVMSFFSTNEYGRISFSAFYERFDAFLEQGLNSGESDETEPEQTTVIPLIRIDDSEAKSSPSSAGFSENCFTNNTLAASDISNEEKEKIYRIRRHGTMLPSKKSENKKTPDTLKYPTLSRMQSRKLSLLVIGSKHDEDKGHSPRPQPISPKINLSPRDMDKVSFTSCSLIIEQEVFDQKKDETEKSSEISISSMQQLQQLRQENENLLYQIETINKKCKQWKEHGQALEEMNASFTEKYDNLSSEIEKKEDEIKELKFRLEQKSNSDVSFQNRENELIDEKKSLQQTIDDLRMRLQAIEVTKEALQLKNAELQTQVDEYAAKENTSAKTDMRRKMTEMKSITHTHQVVRQLQAENRGLKVIAEQHSACQTQLGWKNSKPFTILASKDSEIEQLNHQVSALQYKLSQLEKQLLLYQQEHEIIETPNPEPIHLPELKPKNPEPVIIQEPEPLIIMQQVTVQPSLNWRTREEVYCYARHFNSLLQNFSLVSEIMPIHIDENADEWEFFDKVTYNGGVLLAKYINLIQPDVIDERAITVSTLSSNIKQNFNLVLSAAKSIGVKTMELTAEDLRHPKKHPDWILRFIASLIKTYFIHTISIEHYPCLIAMINDKEERTKLSKLSPENLLLRWFHWVLEKTQYPRKVENIGPDTADCTAFIALMMFLMDPEFIFDESVLSQPSEDFNSETEDIFVCNPLYFGRAKQIVNLCLTLNAENDTPIQLTDFIIPENIAHSNPRLHLLFIAAIFLNSAGQLEIPEALPTSQHQIESHIVTPNLEIPTAQVETTVRRRKVSIATEQSNREESVLRLWINSLEHKEIGYVQDLSEEVKNGLLLLRLEELIEPKGLVIWKKVERVMPLNRFKMISNCNYAVEIAGRLGCSLVGIGGNDIVDANMKFITALIWQLMRVHTLREIRRLQKKLFSDKNVTDEDIIKWANERVKKKGKQTSMASFRDPKLSSCRFFIDLLWSIDPRVVNWDFVNDGLTRNDRILNAKYALSAARKLGATVFVVPQDLVDVKQKMVQMFISAILAVATEIS